MSWSVSGLMIKTSLGKWPLDVIKESFFLTSLRISWQGVVVFYDTGSCLSYLFFLHIFLVLPYLCYCFLSLDFFYFYIFTFRRLCALSLYFISPLSLPFSIVLSLIFPSVSLLYHPSLITFHFVLFLCFIRPYFTVLFVFSYFTIFLIFPISEYYFSFIYYNIFKSFIH